MKATEVIRFRVTPEEKAMLQQQCQEKGTTMSEEIRTRLGFGAKPQSVEEKLDEIFAEIDENIRTCGLPIPSDEEIVAFVNSVREERIAEAMRVYV